MQLSVVIHTEQNVQTCEEWNMEQIEMIGVIVLKSYEGKHRVVLSH
jgi:hypothetical protein